MNTGLEMTKELWKYSDSMAWYERGFTGIIVILVNVLYAAIVGMLLITKIETIMITLAGFVLLVFDGMMNMFDYAKSYLRALISCGFKMFMLAVIMGIIQVFAPKLAEYANPNGSYGFWAGSGMVVSVLVVMWLIARNVSSMVATLLSGAAPGMSSAGMATQAAGVAAMTILPAAHGIANSAKSIASALKGAGSVSSTKIYDPSDFAPKDATNANKGNDSNAKSSDGW